MNRFMPRFFASDVEVRYVRSSVQTAVVGVSCQRRRPSSRACRMYVRKRRGRTGRGYVPHGQRGGERRLGPSAHHAFEAKNSDIKIKLDSSVPSGTEGDNLTKTRLATGEMADMFWYNSGSLFQALNPDQTLFNFGDEAWVGRMNASFRSIVSSDGGVYGAPAGGATGGGVFYHVPTYESLGLKVPTTWAEFMSNNAEAQGGWQGGGHPVVRDTWTSQLFVLADFYNVYASDTDWAEKYTANQVQVRLGSGRPAGFQHLQDVHDRGLLNEDFASTTFD